MGGPVEKLGECLGRREFYSEATPPPSTLMSIARHVSCGEIMKRDPEN